jgi:xanthine/CO dehydrogenase XdhC/CoxF family maturation factor
MLEIDLTDDLGTKGGDVCGGRLRVFVEPFQTSRSQPRLSNFTQRRNP